jgi:hypothetical protein
MACANFRSVTFHQNNSKPSISSLLVRAREQKMEEPFRVGTAAQESLNLLLQTNSHHYSLSLCLRSRFQRTLHASGVSRTGLPVRLYRARDAIRPNSVTTQLRTYRLKNSPSSVMMQVGVFALRMGAARDDCTYRRGGGGHIAR